MIDHLDAGPETWVRRRRDRAPGTDHVRPDGHGSRLSGENRHPRTHGRLLHRLRVHHRLRQPRRRVLFQNQFQYQYN